MTWNELARYFVEQGANASEQLFVCAMDGDLDSIEFLKSLNLPDVDPQFSAMTICAQNGYLDAVKLLAENGESIQDGFQSAAFWGHIEVVKYLGEQGADLHAENEQALRLSARGGHIEVVKYLVEQGADLHARNDEALRSSAEYGHFEVVKYLSDNGAHHHVFDKYDNVAITLSSRNGHIDVTDFLYDQYKDKSKATEAITVGDADLAPIYQRRYEAQKSFEKLTQEMAQKQTVKQTQTKKMKI